MARRMFSAEFTGTDHIGFLVNSHPAAAPQRPFRFWPEETQRQRLQGRDGWPLGCSESAHAYQIRKAGSWPVIRLPRPQVFAATNLKDPAQLVIACNPWAHCTGKRYKCECIWNIYLRMGTHFALTPI